MITSNNKIWKITFFNEVVKNDVLSMPRGIRVRFLGLIEIMQKHGPDLGMPHTRALGRGLFEIRAKSMEGVGRYFYCTLLQDEIIILHCFLKKTQKTPDRHMKLAIQRMNEVKNEQKK